MSEKPALEFFTNDELIDELARRSSALLVAMCPRHESEYSWVLSARGSTLIQQGLGRLMQVQLTQSAREQVRS